MYALPPLPTPTSSASSTLPYLYPVYVPLPVASTATSPLPSPYLVIGSTPLPASLATTSSVYLPYSSSTTSLASTSPTHLLAPALPVASVVVVRGSCHERFARQMFPQRLLAFYSSGSCPNKPVTGPVFRTSSKIAPPEGVIKDCPAGGTNDAQFKMGERPFKVGLPTGCRLNFSVPGRPSFFISKSGA
eukprot:560644-Hanusia_phi.AAC.1